MHLFNRLGLQAYFLLCKDNENIKNFTCNKAKQIYMVDYLAYLNCILYIFIIVLV